MIVIKILLGILFFLLAFYVLIRFGSHAIFKSWRENFPPIINKKERENKNGS